MISSLNNTLPLFIKTLLDDLHQLIGPIYLVGGTVRNCILGKPLSNDLNILVARSLSDCRQLLQARGFTAGMAASRHNVLFLPLKGYEKPKTVEISTFRHRPEQAPSVEEDLLHRDITVNAMGYLWPNGPIIDPFNAEKDLAERKIRLVNGAKTLEDDPLRALRFFRFSLQLSSVPDPVDLASSSSILLHNVPPDRLRVELDRIFSFPLLSEQDQQLFIYMLNTTLGVDLLPELSSLKDIQDQNNPSQTVWDRTIRTLLSFNAIPTNEDLSILDLRWATLLIGISSLFSEQEQLFSSSGLRSTQEEAPYCCKKILEKFCFSKRRLRRISNLLHHLHQDAAPSDRVLRRLLNDAIPAEGLYRLHHAWHQAGISLVDQDEESKRENDANLQAILQRCRILRNAKQRPKTDDLAISGGDILNLVRKEPGPWLGNLQHLLVDYINEDPSRNQQTVLEKRIHDWILRQDSI